MTLHNSTRLGQCCELLSKSYLCIWLYSEIANYIQQKRVVNCFQNRIFVFDYTASSYEDTERQKLWIAFKIVSLYLIIQRMATIDVVNESCELLSKSYLCIWLYSNILITLTNEYVVNCFQNRIFVFDYTALNASTTRKAALWIAFKIVSLYLIIQPFHVDCIQHYSCELLSKSYLCIWLYSQILS